MKTFLFFTFLASLAKSGLWITLGVLIKNHLESALSLVTRKPMPNDIIEQNTFDRLNNVTKWIGIFIILIGIALALSAIATFFMGLRMPTNSFNFKF